VLLLTDDRIEYIRCIINGIRQIKVRCLEPFFETSSKQKRDREISSWSTYCDIRIICSAVYFNSGVILSTILFLMVDRNLLNLGKVFSTLALLGYIFNFSILFSNYAIEALNSIQIFLKRIDESIAKPFEESVKMQKAIT
jgi:hypothetical protein